VETYSEGVQVGYRWYDANDVPSLFPFGHGLSYTSFRYSAPAVRQHGDKLLVSFTLKNTGHRRGEEVAQVYAGRSAAITAPQAERKLVGFRKVALDPGRSQRVCVVVSLQELASWDTATQSWRLGAGRRAISIGGSSAELALTAQARVSVPR